MSAAIHAAKVTQALVMMDVDTIRPPMKYPLQTQSKPVSGMAAKKLLEAIDSGGAVVNDRMLALAKRIAARRRRKALKNG